MDALVPLLVAAGNEIAGVENWMQQAFYPALLIILVAASLGVPIPEDIPLIAAGVLLRTHPGIASWHGTLIVALIGIMSGDLVLYTLGRRWGPEVLQHRFVCWFLTPDRFDRFSKRFHRHGTWFCFFGRFMVGIRAAMCITAGATRFPRWRFLTADLAGALLSAPLFIGLGYWFAGMVPTLLVYLADAQTSVLVLSILVIAGLAIVYRVRKRRRARRIAALRSAARPAAAASCDDRVATGPVAGASSGPATTPKSDSIRAGQGTGG